MSLLLPKIQINYWLDINSCPTVHTEFQAEKYQVFIPSSMETTDQLRIWKEGFPSPQLSTYANLAGNPEIRGDDYTDEFF